MSLNSTLPKWKRELPMILTYSRVLIAPLIMAVLHTSWGSAGVAAAIFFIVASLTDWLDGYFARRYQVESTAGKFMDPIADKILVLGAIVMLLSLGRVDATMVFLLLARDIFIGGIRAVAATNNVIIAAKPFGKWKTGLQMVGIPCLLIQDSVMGGLPVERFGYVLLWVSVVLSLISGVEYTVGYARGRR